MHSIPSTLPLPQALRPEDQTIDTIFSLQLTPLSPGSSSPLSAATIPSCTLDGMRSGAGDDRAPAAFTAPAEGEPCGVPGLWLCPAKGAEGAPGGGTTDGGRDREARSAVPAEAPDCSS